MRNGTWGGGVLRFGLAAILLVLGAGVASAQVSITALDTPVTQDFNTLPTTGTTNAKSTLPLGWDFSESPGNTTYSAGTGSSGTGDTYSFGASGNAERAFGGLRSGAAGPTVGAGFVNNTGSTITSVDIDYFGEQWRLGATGREDRLDFQYSTTATSLSTGAWSDLNDLDFIAPVTTGTVGAINGNANRTRRQQTITGLSIANGATFWIRWSDLDATGSDDGLAVDDFSLTAKGSSPPVLTVSKTADTTSYIVGDTIAYTVDILHDASSKQDAASVVLTDTLPVGVTVLGTGFTFDTTLTDPIQLTTIAGDDAGEIVNGVVTVRVGSLPQADIATVTYHVTVDDREAAGTLSNSASITYNGATSGGPYSAGPSVVTVDVLACLVATDCDDGSACTTDTCDLAGSCQHETISCADTDLCTTDTCDDQAGCQHTTKDCGDGVDCTDDSCDSGSGNCINAPDSTACSDADLCTVDSCNPASGCEYGPDLTYCTDTDPCTDRVCTNSACSHPPNTDPCNDDNECTDNDTCSNGVCAGVGQPCDDGNPCTLDTCTLADGCQHPPDPDATTCSDGNECTTGDICSDGVCSGAPATGGDCSDGDDCTENDTCAAGVCGGTALSCDDGKVCTDDICAGGVCSNPDRVGFCDDATLCNGREVCSAGECVEGAEIDCDDGEVCTDDTCDDVLGCQYADNTNDCDDGLTTTRDDQCSAGLCTGTTIDCPSVGQCEQAIPNGTDCPVTFKPFPASCDDGDGNTANDHCDGFGGCSGTAALPTWTFETSAPVLDNSATISGILPEIGNGTASGVHASATTDWSSPGGSGSDKSFSSNTWNAGGYYQFQASTLGLQDIAFSWEQNRSSTGPATFDLQASTDGVDFTTILDDYTFAFSTWTPFSSGVLGSSYADQPTVYVRLVSQVTPAGGGTCRVDNVTFTGEVIPPDPVLTVSKTADNDLYLVGDTIAYTVDAMHAASSGQDAANVVLTDTLPAGITASEDGFTLDTSLGDPVTLTVEPGDDAGEIVAGVVTVRIGALPLDALATVTYEVTVDDRRTAVTLSNSATLAFTRPKAGGTLGAGPSVVAVDVIACTEDGDCGDDDECTSDTCDADGSCLNPTLSCDDDDPCTIDTCDTQQGCQNTDKVCDDGVTCTDDSCDGDTGACVFAPNDGACSDGDLCTVDHCNAASGCENPDDLAFCDDEDPCTDDLCSASVCSNPFNTAPCDDEDPCTGDDVCSGGVCAGTGEGCDDDNPCTTDTCVPGGCAYEPVTVVTTCNDGNECTTDDVCGGGDCNGTPNTGDACEDGDACTENDTCTDGVCGGATVDCDDDNPCTDDSCDTADGCHNTDNTADCDNGTVCDGHEVCAGGSCGTGTPLDCDDHNDCTDDACDDVLGCQNDDHTRSCDDGLASTSGDTCAGGTCAGTPIVCPTVGQCEEAIPNGEDCPVTNKPLGTTCDDGNAFTSDQCDGVGTCVGVAALPTWTFETSKPGGTAGLTAATIANIAPEIGLGVAGGVHAAAATLWNNPAGNGSSESFSSNNWAATDYYEFQASTLGWEDIVFSWDQTRSGTGPTTFDLLVSTDGTNFTTIVDDYTVVERGWSTTVPDPSFTFTTGVLDSALWNQPRIWVRLVCQTNPAAGGTSRVDNVNFSGHRPPPLLTITQTATPSATPLFPGGIISYSFVIAHEDDSPADATNLVLTDILPAHTTLSGAISVDAPGVAGVSLTAAAHPLAGEVVDGVLTVPLGAFARDDADITVAFDVIVGALDDPTTITNAATLAYGGPGAAPQLATSNTTSIGVVLCDDDGDCADSDPCTDNQCVAGDCATSPNTGASCSDGDPCNGAADACNNGVCEGTTSLDCDDQNPCTNDRCEENVGCQYDDNTVSCDDQNPCTVGDTCAAGACQPGATPANCDDGKSCTDDSCDPTLGCQNLADDTNGCSDGDACTTGDSCSNGACLSGTAVACDDGDVCTSNTCDPQLGCQFPVDPAPAACDDGNPCTTDSCANAACVNTNNTLGCDDGDHCTSNDRCAGGSCGGSAITCDDGKPCTDDSCDPATGCVATNDNTNTCSDGSVCTSGDTCAAGACVPGPALGCDDGNACTTDSCDPVVGCTRVNNAIACNDGLLTTANDVCSSGSCAGTRIVCGANDCQTPGTPNGVDCPPLSKPSGTLCNDGLATTHSDTCNGFGGCLGSPIVCAPPGVCELPGLPNGTDCPRRLAPSGTTCDDGDLATAADRCDAFGTCAGAPIVCPAPNQCQTAGTPDGIRCEPVARPATASCDDGDVATAGDHCDGRGACVGAAIVCPAEDACASWAPNGVDCTLTPTAGPCDDGLDTTHSDVCAEGVCRGTSYACAPSQCELTSVANGTDCTRTFKTPGEPCDDGDVGTRGDLCDGAGACGGTPYACTPGVCEATSVADGVGCVTTPSVPGSACDDRDPCTTDDACDGARACVGVPVECGEGEVCDIGGECRVTHCTPCVDDDECGDESACMRVGAAERCLVACENDLDCAFNQRCLEHADESLRCFDNEGDCAAPEVQPEEDPETVEEVESGPEEVEPQPEESEPEPVEPPPEVVEPAPDVADPEPDVAEADGTSAEAEDKPIELIVTGGGSCATGGPGSLLAMLLGLALLVTARRARRG